MALINKKNKNRIVIDNVLFPIDTIQYKEYLSMYKNDAYESKEIIVYLQSEYNKIKQQLELIGEQVLLANNNDLIKESEFVDWADSGIEKDYNYRFFLTHKQFGDAFLLYPDIMIQLTQVPINPVVDLENGKLTYINLFKPGYKELIESNGIKVEQNPNLV